jgi:hypothetical protein
MNENEPILDQSRFGKERFNQSYQASVGMKAEPKLHANSLELAQILYSYDVLKPGIKIFEMGAGPCRNLYYIYSLQNDIKMFCNDLFKNESIQEMHEDIKNLVTFYEKDSEDMIVNNLIPDLDVFLVSDHFMHLQYDKADKIIDAIIEKWKPKYILLREIKKEFEKPDHPRLYHNYAKFEKNYDVILDKTSNTSVDREKPHLKNAYFIKLLKLKN